MEQQLQQQSDRSSEDVLPPGLPKPVDDHKCDHLWGSAFPSIPLLSTEGKEVDVSKLEGYTIIFCYPRTGKPKEPVPADWDAIPGARGCTPQACSFKAATSQLKGLGITNIFGLSTQDTEHQNICREHLRLGYHLLSDEKFKLCEALRLPMFEWGDMRLVKRVTLLVDHGKIVWIDYPVFPADKSAEKVVEFMEKQPINKRGNPRCGNEPSPAASQSTSSLRAGVTSPSASSSVPLPKSPQAVTNLVPGKNGPMKQGPASNFHPCQDWIDLKAREASLAGVATQDHALRNTGGEVKSGQDGPGKKYSFHFSGGCTTN
ncbi:hypothetical protein SLS57_002437 [Botryosphaeria dothidea]